MFEILLSIDCCVIREWTDDGESLSALTNEKRVWLTIGQLEKRIWQVPHLSWSHCTRCSASEPVQTQNLHYDQTTVLFFLFFAELQTPDGQTTWKAGGIFGNEKVYRKACSVNCQEDLNQCLNEYLFWTESNIEYYSRFQNWPNRITNIIRAVKYIRIIFE